VKRIITQPEGVKDMKHTFAKQARRAGSALAAVGALAALGIGTAQAAPPTGVPTFESAKFSIAAGTGTEEGALLEGGLTCGWRETGLQPFQLIVYTCDADVVGAIQACVDKNKIVEGSPTLLTVVKHPLVFLTEAGAVVGVGFVSNNKGQINGTTTTPVPVSAAQHGFCAEPAVPTVVSVRWCNAALTDTTNNLVGGTAVELFKESFAGAGTVPSCADLLASP
jgi:hypothetical protein